MLKDEEYEKIKKEVLRLMQIDLNDYKPAQMRRRIASLIPKYKLKSLDEFIEIINNDSVMLQNFKDFITINVTEFFRNADRFDSLSKKVLPDLIDKMKKGGRKKLNIWSAGSSIGAEAYTLAMIMAESFPRVDYSILGTDIDKLMLAVATKGVYKENEVKSISNYLKRKYMTEDKESGLWAVKDNLKQKVRFMHNNLLKDPFRKGYDLILCRNVVIYFTEEAKDKLYHKFYDSLYDGGVLFVGGTESILRSREIGFRENRDLFYYK